MSRSDRAEVHGMGRRDTEIVAAGPERLAIAGAEIQDPLQPQEAGIRTGAEGIVREALHGMAVVAQHVPVGDQPSTSARIVDCRNNRQAQASAFAGLPIFAALLFLLGRNWVDSAQKRTLSAYVGMALGALAGISFTVGLFRHYARVLFSGSRPSSPG